MALQLSDILQTDEVYCNEGVRAAINRVVTELNIGAGGDIQSTAPSGHYRVTNLYVNATTGRLVVEYDDVPV